MFRFGRLTVAVGVVAAVLAGSLSATAQEQAAEPKGKVEQVGHNSLLNRGMNAALAVHGDYAYVGSRTDGLHPNSGVMIVNVSDPAAPAVEDQIQQTPMGANLGETSREMRIWPQQELLVVLYLSSNCSYLIHECSPTSAVGDDTYRFYDISGEKAAAPELVAEYVPANNPHEFFLWADPKNPKRALIFQSEPGSGTQFSVIDISGARDGKFTELGTFKALIPDAGDNRIHSLSVSTDGEIAYIASLQGGFYQVDVSAFSNGEAKPKGELITPIPNRVHWDGPGAHSAVKIPSRPYALVTDEVYGQIPVLLAGHGCPWGWTRFVDIKDPEHPKVVGEYKLPQNEEDFCSDPVGDNPVRDASSSWAAHNPTLTKHLALITWHSGGFQVVDTTDPAKPVQTAAFSPTPEPAVVTEDPVLSSGQDKVVMWSYPVVEDGLIYVVDIRNGLYILKYTGPYEKEISKVKFLEGNSNLGDALKLEKP